MKADIKIIKVKKHMTTLRRKKRKIIIKIKKPL